MDLSKLRQKPQVRICRKSMMVPGMRWNLSVTWEDYI